VLSPAQKQQYQNDYDNQHDYSATDVHSYFFLLSSGFLGRSYLALARLCMVGENLPPHGNIGATSPVLAALTWLGSCP
jgi:hypothetical protein